jgi:hypothetical protein
VEVVEMQEFELRLQRLERDNRRLRWALVVLALSLIAVILAFPVGATAQQRDFEAQSIYAQGFWVRNGAGTIVASVSATSDGGGGLTLYRPNGDPGVVMSVSSDRSAVGLTGKPSYDAGIRQTTFVVEMSSLENASGALQLKDASGRMLFSIP